MFWLASGRRVEWSCPARHVPVPPNGIFLEPDHSRSTTELFGGRSLFRRLAQGWEINEQFFCFEEQKKRLTNLHEVYMVDLPTFDHSRLC